MITFENRDCIEALKEFPDKFFELAIVDPPYGDALHAESGGGKGWFTKYNMKVNTPPPPAEDTIWRDVPEEHRRGNDETSRSTEKRDRRTDKPYNRFGGRFDKYKRPFSTDPLVKNEGGGVKEQAEHGPQSTVKKS